MMEQNAYPTSVPDDLNTGYKTEKDESHDDAMGFVRKVLGIVAGQLTITFAIILCAAIGS
jgi:hypothetical protein